MKKGLFFAAAFLGLFILTQAAYAEKVAFVDVGKVFDGYEKTKKNDEALTEEGRKRQGERDALVQEVRRLKDEQALLSDKAKGQKQAAIDEKIRQLQDFDTQIRRDLGGRRDTVVKEIFADIDNLIKTYGKQKGYDYIMNQRLALYNKDQYDISDEILKMLNDDYKKKGKKK